MTRSDDDFPTHLGEYHGALNREWERGMRSGLTVGFWIGVAACFIGGGIGLCLGLVAP